MSEPSPKRACATCRRSWSQEAFYDGCAECKDCKKERSRDNRQLQAQKIAAFERLADALAVLARQNRMITIGVRPTVADDTAT